MLALPLNRTTRCRLLIFLFLLTGLLGTGVGAMSASAQQPDTAEVDTTARDDLPTTADSSVRKSPSRAVWYSLGGTVLLTPLAIGPFVGPSLGHFYAGDHAQAWTGIGIRGGALLLPFLTVEIAGRGLEAGLGAGYVAIAVIVVSAIYDIVTAPRSAREYNEAHGLSARVTPTVGPEGEQVGLSLRVSF